MLLDLLRYRSLMIPATIAVTATLLIRPTEPFSLIAILLAAIPIYRLSPLHPLYGFPGPVLFKISELPMFYHALRGTRHVVVKRLHDRYGSVVQTGPNSVSFTSLTAIREIYASSHALDKTTAYDMHSIKGQGLFFIKDRATHAHRRRIWNRSFSQQALFGYRETIVSKIQNLVLCLLKRTEQDGRVDLVKILPQYAYDSTNAVFFSGQAFNSVNICFSFLHQDHILNRRQSLLESDDPEQIVSEATAYFGAFEFFGHAELLFRLVKNLPGISRFLKFEALATEAARRRLEHRPTFRDGISYWLEGNTGQPNLADSDLPIESETVLIGGSDTVGAIATFAMYFLLTNPQWFELLRQELDGTFHKDNLNDNLDALDQLVCLNAFIQESLRLGMPFSGLPRIIPPDGLSINGRYVPGGTHVNVPVWTHHVDQTYFPDPYTFDPTRWIKDGNFSQSSGLLLTFGAGPFNCVGSKLAYVQLRVLLANLVVYVDLIPTTEFDPAKFWNGVRNCRATSFLEPLYARVVPRR